MVKVDLSGAASFFTAAGPDYARAGIAHETLASRSGLGADFTGWLELPQRIQDTELPRILAAAQKIRSRSQALVVVGIGGSYLGARGAIELLKPVPGKGDPRVYFVGNTLSVDTLCDTMEQLGDADFDVNVISKSGTTLEPAVSFRIFRQLLEKKYGDKADEHIFATTDARRGALKSLADQRGWPCFVVPDDVGGRFSVLSAVGLLPMAVAGIDVRRVIDAAIAEFKALDLRSPENPAWQYAAVRQHRYSTGKTVEILGCYEPSFRFMAEWWKQLYGESEGKDGIGIFPASVEFTADLHSMGQYVQDGERLMMETFVRVCKPSSRVPVPEDKDNLDGMNYLVNKSLTEINDCAAEGTIEAHVSGGVPVVEIEVDRIDEYTLGQLIYFFEFACGVSGYMLGVNPFDQPGVEAYKKNMFRLLGKPGF